MEKCCKSAAGLLRFSEPELYVDNAARKRSGHMSHAMVEYAPGQVLAFNSNCSAARFWGHSAYGWIECRHSPDGGKHWGNAWDFPYAKEAFLNGVFTVSVEKAVACSDGSIVAFCLRNTPYREACCEPWLTPVSLKSRDGGHAWTPPQELSPYKGRVYDAVYYQNSIWVLEFCNDAEISFTGNKPEHVYRIFKSDDHGESFQELGIVDLETAGHGYGAMIFRPDGTLLVYAYNIEDEYNMDIAVSSDGARTWKRLPPGKVAKGIRNPQIGTLDGAYILHGRAANGKGFVIYTSADGEHWDEGFMYEPEKEACYYSNNLTLRDEKGKERMLLQYSETYQEACVNVKHMWLDFVER